MPHDRESPPFGVQAPHRVGHGAPPRHIRAREASRPVFTPTFSQTCLLVPQPDRAGSAVPQAFASRGDQWRQVAMQARLESRGFGRTAGRLMARRSAPPFTRAFTSPSPEPGSDAGTVTCSFTSRPPDAERVADRSCWHSTRRPPRPGRRSPEMLAVHLVVPRPSSRRPHDVGRGWEALVGLVVHGTA
jgi:hypothetical protein